MAKKKEEDEEEELKKIKAGIEEKKLRWKAESNEMTKLSPKERKKRLGSRIEDEELESILREDEERLRKKGRSPREGGHLNPAPPSEWDWRDVSGQDWTTQIRSQGGCGSCVAFAVCGALEMHVKRWVYNDATISPDFSEAHLFFCNNRDCDPDDPNYGWWLSEALDYLKNNGVPDDACYPYTANNQDCNTCNDWESRTNLTKLKDWRSTSDITEMKKLLSEHGCLMTSFLVYNDFYAYSSGIYEYSGNDPVNDLLGGHAVAVVGYSDVDDCWICKNSWGTWWGEQGWFRIAYGECGIDNRMYTMNLVCPAEASATLMGISSADIRRVRRYRDRLLRTRKGRAYLQRGMQEIGAVAKAYYVLQKNPALRKKAAQVVKPFIAAVKKADAYRAPKLKEVDLKSANKVLDEFVRADRTLKPYVDGVKWVMSKYGYWTLRRIMGALR